MDEKEVTEKTCTKCLQTKFLGEFNRAKKGGLGYFSRCRQCRAWDKKFLYKENPTRKRVHRARYQVKNKTQHVAHNTVTRFFRNGDLSKEPCVVCGEGKVEAHHSDYRKPLDVMWLCPTHHRAWHRVFQTEDKDLTKTKSPAREGEA